MMKKIILIISIFFVIISCGSRGDLILEPEALPTKITDLKINQVGNELLLIFTLPELLSDKTPLNKSDITKIYVYRSRKDISEEKFRKKGKLVLKINKPNSVFSSLSESKVIINLPMKVKELNKKEYFFGIIYYKKKNHSPMSVIKTISTRIPYPSVKKFTLTHEKKIVLLKWKCPEYDVKGNKITVIAGYNIYRKSKPHIKENEKGSDKKTANIEEIDEGRFIKINTEPIKDNYYEDTDTTVEGKYSYMVSIAYNKKIESKYSNIMSIEIKDIYPPEIPGNLFAFTGKGFMLLNWDEVADKDFDHYNIYRKQKYQKVFKKIADNIVKSRYKDKNVKKGVIYQYYITAVDDKDNESEASNIVKEKY